MRISSNQIHQVAVNAMLDQQSKLSETQHQVATGERVSSAADDPVAAARIVDLQQAVDNFEQYQSSINSSRARLEVQEGVLENVVSALQRVRELIIQANNAIQTNDTRGFIAEEIHQLNEEIQGLSNSIDSNNDYLFSGSKVKFKPFTNTSHGNYQYNGDDGQRMMQIGPNRQLSSGDSGSDVFRLIRNGNGGFMITTSSHNTGSAIANPGYASQHYATGHYELEFKLSKESNELFYQINDSKGKMVIAPSVNTKYHEQGEIEFFGVHTSFKGKPHDGDRFVFSASKNQDMFATLRNLESILNTARTTPDSKALLSNNLNQSIVSIDQALENVLKIRSNTGSRLKALDNQQEINSSHLLHLKQIQSEIKDLDYTEAVTRLNLRLTGLEASQKAYSKVQNLSMFDYI